MWLINIFDHFPLKVIVRVYPWRHEILQTRSLVFTIVKHPPKLQGFFSAQSSRYRPTSFDGCKQTAWFDHPLASPTHSPDWRRFIALVWPQSVPQPFTQMDPHQQLTELFYGLDFCPRTAVLYDHHFIDQALGRIPQCFLTLNLYTPNLPCSIIEAKSRRKILIFMTFC